MTRNPSTQKALAKWLVAGGLLGLLTACGGSLTDSSTAPSQAARARAMNYSPAMLPPLTSSGPKYYFSDCQAGAVAGCVPGDNTNDGTTPATAKRTLDNFDVSTLPAGSQVLFARGGAWNDFSAIMVNLNVTPTDPLIFDSYPTSWSSTAMPVLKVSGGVGFGFGWYGDTVNDGGYTVRNLKLDGEGVGVWGVFVQRDTRNLTLDNLEISGFALGIHSQNAHDPGLVGNSYLTVRGSFIHDNREMGMLGDADDMVIENNVFAWNNYSGSVLNHAIYIGGQGHRGIVRYNRFENNSVADGVCKGGNVTVHGQWDGLLIEGNVVSQEASAEGCYGISIIPGYTSAEWFRNVVVRSNIVVNLGSIAIGASAAPGIIIENNLVVNTQNTLQLGIVVPASPPGEGDDADGGAIVRNNTVYFSHANGSSGIALRELYNEMTPERPLLMTAGTNLTMVSNLVSFGPDSGVYACFQHAPVANFTTFDNNLCHLPGSGGMWSTAYSTHALAQAAGLDLHGIVGDPLFVTPPSMLNWTDALQSGSPAIDTGHASLSSLRDRALVLRTVPNIGSRE